MLASVSGNTEPTPEEQDKSLDKPKQKKNRCFMCRKKVGLTGKNCEFYSSYTCLGFGPLKGFPKGQMGHGCLDGDLK